MKPTAVGDCLRFHFGNTYFAVLLQTENAIPISSWTHQQDDEELIALLPVLNALRSLQDVRSVLGLRTTGVTPIQTQIGARARSV